MTSGIPTYDEVSIFSRRYSSQAGDTEDDIKETQMPTMPAASTFRVPIIHGSRGRPSGGAVRAGRWRLTGVADNFPLRIAIEGSAACGNSGRSSISASSATSAAPDVISIFWITRARSGPAACRSSAIYHGPAFSGIPSSPATSTTCSITSELGITATYHSPANLCGPTSSNIPSSSTTPTTSESTSGLRTPSTYHGTAAYCSPAIHGISSSSATSLAFPSIPPVVGISTAPDSTSFLGPPQSATAQLSPAFRSQPRQATSQTTGPQQTTAAQQPPLPRQLATAQRPPRSRSTSSSLLRQATLQALGQQFNVAQQSTAAQSPLASHPPPLRCARWPRLRAWGLSSPPQFNKLRRRGFLWHLILLHLLLHLRNAGKHLDNRLQPSVLYLNCARKHIIHQELHNRRNLNTLRKPSKHEPSPEPPGARSSYQRAAVVSISSGDTSPETGGNRPRVGSPSKQGTTGQSPAAQGGGVSSEEEAVDLTMSDDPVEDPSAGSSESPRGEDLVARHAIDDLLKRYEKLWEIVRDIYSERFCWLRNRLLVPDEYTPEALARKAAIRKAKERAWMGDPSNDYQEEWITKELGKEGLTWEDLQRGAQLRGDQLP
ncbi:unnamed protein product [Parascedosporium putredinis]|uniref:Uncharacterized protein n=1 Tax=Parascedosporium putredinis TaxID=1442378 RepID=A0A9P1HAQ5_9PEZI|nr:unnamed protein product [Parascedosporium putredinis]CAI8002312.1 unnamed protein product [Parascedosporium putredinis]